MTSRTFNAYHLGDNIIHLHFLRKLAQRYPDAEFEHYCAEQHRVQLRPIIADLPQIRLLEICPTDAINAWRGVDGFWHKHNYRNDFVTFHQDWFRHLRIQMGFPEGVIDGVDSLMMDYPALDARANPYPKFDYLVINSIPHSGQFSAYNPHEFDRMIKHMLKRGKSVITTAPTNTDAKCTNDGMTGMDVTEIGRLSQSARCIIGVPTGPIWPTFNIWNRETDRVLMLDNERVDLGVYVYHVQSVAEAMKLLE